MYKKRVNGLVFSINGGSTLMIGGLVMIENREKRECEIKVYGSENINYRVMESGGVNMYYFKQYNDLVYPVYDADIQEV